MWQYNSSVLITRKKNIKNCRVDMRKVNKLFNATCHICVHNIYDKKKCNYTSFCVSAYSQII